MVIKSEKKSKQKFGMTPTKHRRNIRLTTTNLHRDVRDDWLPIPKHKHRAFLADIAAAKKARAEGKLLNRCMFDKYFQGPGKVYQPKPLANWKELVHELKEKEAAKTKANSLKRKMKKALSKSKGTAAIDIQKQKEEAASY